MKEGKAKDTSKAGWKYTGGSTKVSAPSKSDSHPAANFTGISWTASEYIEHDKSASWYGWFCLAAAAVIGGIYVLTRDLFSVILLSFLAVVFGVFAARKPKVLQYQLDDRGLTIGQKFYPMNLFRSFAVIEEGPFRSVTLLPMKRFMPAISLYFSPEDETAILDAFSSLLPQEIRQQDALDKFMHRIRF